MIYTKFMKRMIDISLSFIAIIILSPLIFILYILVYFKIGRPVLFIQDRPGLNGKIFKMYKFRSMTNEKDSNGKLLPDEQRITGFGNFIRTTSLDELPQLFNILKGDISIIGPRALLTEYLNEYTPLENKRHQVKPGLVGLAALYGRQNQSWKSKFEKDIYYVDHISFRMDMRIMIGAVKVVLSKKDVYQDETNKKSFFEREKLYENSCNCSSS